MTPEEARRLAFSKYLFGLGIRHVRQAEPQAGAGLLMLHDAVEFFLQISSEHLNVGKLETKFIEYWDLLNPKLQPHGLPLRESMRRLNRARVALKHHGTQPSRLDLEDFASNVGRFLEEATPMIFQTSFDTISLIEFVKSEQIREPLRTAVASLETSDLNAGLVSCAQAFARLIAHYTSTFPFGLELRLRSLPIWRIPGRTAESEITTKALEALAGSVDSLQEGLTIIALGMDFRSYSRFLMLTPNVIQFQDGHWETSLGPKVPPSREGLSFCVDFLIESVLRLQELD